MTKQTHTSLKLTDDDLKLLRALRDDIEENRKKIDTMEHWFSRVVRTYGVDLDHERWSLDLDTGTLEREDASTLQTTGE